VLIRFSRLASEANSGSAILPLLVDAAIEHTHAAGAVVVEIVEGWRTRVVAACGVPSEVLRSEGDADAIGEELGAQLVATAREGGRTFARARTLPLVSTGGLFGALVLLCASDHEADGDQLAIAQALVDLAAIAVGRANQLTKLEKANAELLASREVLARSEKLRSLGQMAAGLTHDLKNVLNPLSLHAQIIDRAVARGDGERAKESVREMRAVIQRGIEMLERLRGFSRQTPEARTIEVDLSRLATEAVSIARPRMSSRKGALCRIVEDLGEVPPVLARPDEIVAAVVNLVVNAMDAMPDGGTITIRTQADGQGGATITVADDGPGMSPDVQARVFEPFFTTKGAEGTGLGLAMVFATMQRCGGHVALDTAPGRGAAFTLSFPASRPR